MMQAGFVDCDSKDETKMIQKDDAKEQPKREGNGQKKLPNRIRSIYEASTPDRSRDCDQYQAAKPEAKVALADTVTPNPRSVPGNSGKHSHESEGRAACAAPKKAPHSNTFLPAAQVDTSKKAETKRHDPTDERLDKLLSSPHLIKALDAKKAEPETVRAQLEATKEKNGRDAARKAKKHLEKKARKKSLRVEELEAAAVAKEEPKTNAIAPKSRAEALQLAMGNVFSQESAASPPGLDCKHVDVMFVELPEAHATAPAKAAPDADYVEPDLHGCAGATEELKDDLKNEDTNADARVAAISTAIPAPRVTAPPAPSALDGTEDSCAKTVAAVDLPVRKKEETPVNSAMSVEVAAESSQPVGAHISGSTVWKQMMGTYTVVEKMRHFNRPVFQCGKWFMYYHNKAWRCSSAVGKDKCNLTAVGTSQTPHGQELRWAEQSKTGGVAKISSRIKVKAVGAFGVKSAKVKSERGDPIAESSGRNLAQKRVKEQAAKKAEEAAVATAASQAKVAAKASAVEYAAKVRENSTMRRAKRSPTSTGKQPLEPPDKAQNDRTVANTARLPAAAPAIEGAGPAAAVAEDGQDVRGEQDEKIEPPNLENVPLEIAKAPQSLPTKAVKVPVIKDTPNQAHTPPLGEKDNAQTKPADVREVVATLPTETPLQISRTADGAETTRVADTADAGMVVKSTKAMKAVEAGKSADRAKGVQAAEIADEVMAFEVKETGEGEANVFGTVAGNAKDRKVVETAEAISPDKNSAVKAVTAEVVAAAVDIKTDLIAATTPAQKLATTAVHNQNVPSPAVLTSPPRSQDTAAETGTPPVSKLIRSPAPPPEIVRTPGNSFQSDEWRQVNATLFAKLEAEKEEELRNQKAPEQPKSSALSPSKPHAGEAAVPTKVLGFGWKAAALSGLQYPLVGDTASDGSPPFLPTRTVKLARQPAKGFGFEVVSPSPRDMGVRIAAVKLGGAGESAGVRVGEILVSINSKNVLDCRTTASIAKEVKGLELTLALTSVEHLDDWNARKVSDRGNAAAAATGQEMTIATVQKGGAEKQGETAPAAGSGVPARAVAGNFPASAPENFDIMMSDDPHSVLLDRFHTFRDKLARSLHASKDAGDRHAKKQEVARIDATLEWLAERDIVVDVHIQRCCSPDGKSLGFQVTNAGSMFGARVTVVHDGGAAELAGILPGDILVQVGGIDVLWSFTSEIIKRIKECGSVATIAVCRPSAKSRMDATTTAIAAATTTAPLRSGSSSLDEYDGLIPEEDFETVAKDALELAASQAGASMKKAWSSFVTFCEESTSALLDDDGPTQVARSSSVSSVSSMSSSPPSPRRSGVLNGREGVGNGSGSGFAPARSSSSSHNTSVHSMKRSDSYGSISSMEPEPPASGKVVRKYLVRRQPSDSGRWGLSLQVEEGHKGSLLRLDAITAGGALWRAGGDAEEGSVLVAVNGVFAIGLTLKEVTGRISSSPEKIVIAVCSYEELFNVSQKELVDNCTGFDFSQDADVLAAEAELKLVEAWDRFTDWVNDEGEKDEDREWETPVKVVVPVPVVVPASKRQVSGTMLGDRTCAMCGIEMKSIIFGCGHAACSTCSAKCHACPVKGCRRIILTRTQMAHRFRSAVHEEMCRGTAPVDLDSGCAPRLQIHSATVSTEMKPIGRVMSQNGAPDSIPADATTPIAKTAAHVLSNLDALTPDAKPSAAPTQKVAKKSRRRLVAVEEWLPSMP